MKSAAAIGRTSGARLGRVTMAAAAAKPARPACAFDLPMASTIASSHHAVTGTSLIGHIN
jgi:hypothetical protein